MLRPKKNTNQTAAIVCPRIDTWPFMRTFSIFLLSWAAYGAEYTIDSTHSAASFGVRHMMVSTVRGQFSKLTGKVGYDPKNLAACKVEATVDATTIDTREPKRDAHLKSPDFFDVAKFPTLTFLSTKCAREGGKLKITGDLTIHGVTRPVLLDVDNLIDYMLITFWHGNLDGSTSLPRQRPVEQLVRPAQPRRHARLQNFRA